jgi:outer membrane lipoprotein-sorting protein
MQRQLRELIVCLGLVLPGLAVPAAFAAGNDSLPQVIARMDKAANEFKSMTAQVTYVTHTEVLNEDDTEMGTITMKKVHAGEVQGLVDFTSPDRKTIAFEKRTAEEYLPKLKTVQVFDLSKHGEQIDKFIMIGFGTSGSELANDYDMTILGTENWKNQPAIVVQLIPKAADKKQYVQKLQLWIPAQGDPYPLHEKILEPSGDYRLVTYVDLKINPPLGRDALKLKVPPGVETVHPGQ